MQNTEEEPITPQNERSAPAAHPRYLNSSPAGATLHGKTQGFVAKLSPKTKPMQHPCRHYKPFHCDLQLGIQQSHRTTYTRRTTHCRTQRRNRFAPPRPQPQPPHTRGTFHRRPEPLYTEKHTVSCPNYLPKRSPCNIHAAITMRFAPFIAIYCSLI